MEYRQISSFDGNLLLIMSILAVYTVALLVQRRKPKTAERLGLKLEGGVLIFRTEKFNDTIRGFASKHLRAVKLFGDLSAFAGFALMVYGLYFFHANLLSFFSEPEAASPVSPIVPGLNVGVDVLPYFLLAVFLAIVPHELAHALTASAEGIPLKSTGLFLAVVFPGGFAEIDEEHLEKAGLKTKLRVLSSGSVANILTFLFLLLLALLLVQPLGVRVTGTLPGYPAEGVLKPGDVILSVNGVRAPTLEDFSRLMAKHRPGDTVTLTILRNSVKLNVSITLAPRPENSSRGFLGIQIQQSVSNEDVYNIVSWGLIVTSSVAVINMLPIVPLDGGRIFRAIVEKLLGQSKARTVTVATTAYTIFLVALNIFLSTNIYGLLRFP
ncbi:site-2 protease family protein [Infirmifilum lucidum]|uniref:Site-2 protease family protein n=1 Tax=Infirmifilum lucidum TaxID=2776706 RepID=A0A7L9FIH4_9CREN|nr:site-2 protease family protein [Infirmifilum lucidum]QOJ79431.1 site-2 protease family protein [Infirmifilum lucidum]